MDQYLVAKRAVDARDPSLIVSAVMECLERWSTGGEFIPVNFGIDGFDDDPRPLYDIDEVRKWAAALLGQCNFILALVDGPTMTWLVPAIADIEVIERKPGATRWRIAPATEDSFVQGVLHARETVFRRLARSDEEYEVLCTYARPIRLDTTRCSGPSGNRRPRCVIGFKRHIDTIRGDPVRSAGITALPRATIASRQMICRH